MKIQIPKNNIDNVIYDILQKWKEEFNDIEVINEDRENILINNNIILYPYNEKKTFNDKQKVIYLYSENSKWCYFNRNSIDIYNYNIDSSYNLEKRAISTIFHGKINSEEKIRYRTNDWKDYIENFNLVFEDFEISKIEYFNLLKKTKYGICLKGDSIKSNHLLDYLAIGVIPLVTEDIDLSFFENLICGLHYFRISSGNDIIEIIKNTSEEHLNLMSENCKKWYFKNCSITGSYNNLLKLLNNLNNSNNLNQIELSNEEYDETNLNTTTNISNEIVFHKNQINSITILNDSSFDNIYNSIINNNIKIPIITNNNTYDVEFKNIDNKYELIKYSVNKYGNTLYISNNFLIKNKLPEINIYKDIGLKKICGKYDLDCLFIKNLHCLEWVLNNINNLTLININYDIFMISNSFIEKKSTSCTNLIINYIDDINRRDDFLKCIQKNIDNKFISNIYCFLNENIDTNDILKNKKIKIIRLEQEYIYFNDVIKFINLNLNNNINILCNSDVYIEHKDWQNCITDDNIILCQSAYLINNDFNIISDKYITTPEGCNKLKAFVFKNNIKINFNSKIKLGFDNNEVIITKLLKDNNYNIFNLPSTNKVFNLNENMIVYMDKETLNQPYYLLPNYLIINSNLEEIFKILNINNDEKYKIISNIFTKYIKILN
jgi:hypothetical protein